MSIATLVHDEGASITLAVWTCGKNNNNNGEAKANRNTTGLIIPNRTSETWTVSSSWTATGSFHSSSRLERFRPKSLSLLPDMTGSTSGADTLDPCSESCNLCPYLVLLKGINPAHRGWRVAETSAMFWPTSMIEGVIYNLFSCACAFNSGRCRWAKVQRVVCLQRMA